MKIPLALVMILFAAVSAPAGERRAAGAHEHGHGALRAVVENAALFIEIEAPGADIVGFEHPPRSDADRAAIEAAVEQLKDAAALFMLPDAAGCAIQDVEIHAPREDARHEEPGSQDHDEHSEFVARYHFECGDVGALDVIRTSYFERFANAEELDAEILTPAGASVQELDAANPVVELPR